MMTHADTPPVPRPEVVAWLKSRIEGVELSRSHWRDKYKALGTDLVNREIAVLRAALRDVERCAEMEDAEYRDRGVTITPEIAALLAPPGAEP